MADTRSEITRRYYERHRAEILVRQRTFHENNPNAKWAYSLKRRHGMRPEDWSQMWDDQDGRCYLCQEPMDGDRPRSIAIDHDWRCCPEKRSCATCRRGLAHNTCNRWLARMKDDPALIRLFAERFEAVAAEVTARLAAAPVQDELPINVRRLERREESA